MEKVTIVRGDDWEGLYLDGKLLDQGHHIDWDYVLDYLGYAVESKEADFDWLGDRGVFPARLADCQLI